MPPGVKHTKMEQLLQHCQTRIAQLEAVIFATPLFHRKDVARILGVSDRTITRRMKRRDFPKPIYDAGRPKWCPSDFSGQTGQTVRT